MTQDENPARRAGRAQRERARSCAPVPAPDSEGHVLPELDLDEVWPYLNPQMLYAKHLGLRGSYRKLKEAGDPKPAGAAKPSSHGVQARGMDPGARRCIAISRRRPKATRSACSTRRPACAPRFTFPRQAAGERLCLADFVRPADRGGPPDRWRCSSRRPGRACAPRAEELKNAGEYLLCHSLQALAVETAEAAAEWLHRQHPRALGLPRPAGDRR